MPDRKLSKLVTIRTRAGTPVVVVGGGCDNGKTGVLLNTIGSRHLLKLDGHCVPQLGKGHYKPFDRDKDRIVRMSDGSIDALPRYRLARRLEAL
jgi:hypothetical protein